ncbi:MAG TPA: TonB-dependent receptor plug domain-containing protein, partial [Saprospiraceae bacterium]|nr:TonB-dependent receptor plug domain-containing protein [Saprospiraceae bacterium]
MRPVSLNPVFAVYFCFFASALFGQDSTSKVMLQEIEIRGQHFRNELARLPETQGSFIFSGKKNEVVHVCSLDADLSSNQARQLFAKVPGISIWESDGSGIQTGVSSRGLSPNRSWEFNVRQNGYDICSEVFGYPEAYYSPPAEAIEKIELVRGAASLQFGPQFGGLLNYQIKKAPKDRPISFESMQTLGSYGLFNSYNALGGTLGKWSYYGYYHHRSADGWRENSAYRTNTGYLSINYSPNPKWNIGLDYTRMDYLSQQAGGLTDSLFRLDSRQSLRARNWFSAPWNVGSITLEYNWNEQSRFTLKLFGTHSQRNSVGFTKAINIPDTFNLSLNAFNPRQVDRDRY